jgi:signal transduction histidine kinase
MLLASLTTLPAFLFVIYIATNERSEVLRRAEREARFVAEMASREHAHQVAGVQRLLETLARNEASSLPPLLPAVLAGFPQVANLWSVDREGTLAYSVVPPPRHIAIRDNPVFERAVKTGEVAVGEYQMGPIVGRPVLLMAKAAADHVLIAALELSWLDQLARQSGLPDDSALVITDRTGRVLAGAEGTIAGFSALTGDPGKMREVTIDGAERLSLAVPLQGTRDVWVVVGPLRRSVYALANRIFYRDLAVLALFALFAVATSLITTDLSVLRDVRLLAAATRRFGRGEMSVRAPVPRPRGEIRELSTAFNAMADEIEQRQERLSALSQRLSAAREEEAARIAQELHDQLGQELTVLKLDLENLRRRAAAGSADLPSWIDEMDRRISTAADTVRRISSDLRPGVLDRLGLVAGLEWLLREFERSSGITTDIAAGPLTAPVHTDVATALFRITQEALTNVARHANASLVEVRLRDTGSALELRLHDDGRGFDAQDVRRTPSLGLLGIEERARRLGGSVTIESKPGKGTTVTVVIPRIRL